VIVLFSSRSTLADLLSPDYVEQIAEETVYGFSKLYSIPLLNPSRFYRGLPPSLVLCRSSQDTRLQLLQLQLADSWVAIFDRAIRYYLHVSTTFATLILKLLMTRNESYILQS